MAHRLIEQAFALVQQASSEMYKTPVNTACECSILAARKLLAQYIELCDEEKKRGPSDSLARTTQPGA